MAFYARVLERRFRGPDEGLPIKTGFFWFFHQSGMKAGTKKDGHKHHLWASGHHFSSNLKRNNQRQPFLTAMIGRGDSWPRAVPLLPLFHNLSILKGPKPNQPI